LRGAEGDEAISEGLKLRDTFQVFARKKGEYVTTAEMRGNNSDFIGAGIDF
jgi:hypothetical protein